MTTKNKISTIDKMPKNKSDAEKLKQLNEQMAKLKAEADKLNNKINKKAPKKEPKKDKYKVMFNGVNYSGNSKMKLAKEMNVSLNVLNRLLQGDEKLYVYDDDKKKIVVVNDTRKEFKPLLKRQFKTKEEMQITKTQNTKNKKIDISFNYPKQQQNAKHLRIYYKYTITFSTGNIFNSDDVERYGGVNDIDIIEQYIHEKMKKEWENVPHDELETEIIKIETYRSPVKKYNKMKLRDVKALCLFNENIEHVKSDNNCVKDYLLSIHKKGTIKQINKMDNDGVTPDDILQYCNNNKIPCRLYNYENKFICGNDIKSCKHFKGVYAMCYNNHIYPFKNKHLLNMTKKQNINKKVVVLKDNIAVKVKLMKTIINEELPYNISMSHDNFNSFECEECIYTCNQEYTECKKLCDMLGIKDIHHTTNYKNVHKLIIPLYTFHEGKHINASSCMPNSDQFTCSGFLYSVPSADVNRIIECMDKNKCYGSILKNLDYLISIDYKKCNFEDKKFILIDEYFYIVNVDNYESTILIPENNMYTGKHLKFCDKEGVKYDIKEQISTTKHFNYFRQMIIDIYKFCPKGFKYIINPLIGSMQQKQLKEKLKFKHKLCTYEEAECSEGVKMNLNNDYCIMTTDEQIMQQNKCFMPIAYQVVEGSYRLMYEKMKSLNLNTSDIVQIKTDSIAFYKNDVNIKYDSPDDIDGWKKEEFKKCNSHDPFFKDEMSFKRCMAYDEQITRLITGYAGNGKSYDIKNHLLPNLNTFCLVTPSHACLTPYKKDDEKFKASVYEKKGSVFKVVQTYLFSHEVPDCENLIVDEVGMFDYGMWNFIIKCVTLNKNIYCYGDFRQSLPVGCDKQMNTPLLMSVIFNEQKTLKGNHRNDFTEEFYDEIITGNNKNSKKNVYKYSTDWKEADYIICYRNKTVDEYNKLKMDFLNIKFGDIGCRIMCRQTEKNKNKLVTFSKNKEIYNKHRFIIEKYDGEDIILKSSCGALYKITKDELNIFFIPAYALTLYNIQGEGVRSYHYAKEDDFFLNNRNAYTCISRLQTKNF